MRLEGIFGERRFFTIPEVQYNADLRMMPRLVSEGPMQKGRLPANVPAGRRGQMSDQWLFKSETYDNCNCAVNCGCQFNLPTTHGHCQSAFVGNIVEGHFNNTPLAGLNWAKPYL